MASTQAVTPNAPPEDFRLVDATFTTYTTALPTFDNLADSNNPPTTDTANGRYVADKPAGESLAVRFCGTGSDNQTINYMVIAWNRIVNPATGAVQWTPDVQVQGVATLSAKVGISGGNVFAETVRYADTITVTVDRTRGPLFARVLAGTAGDESWATLVIPMPKCHKVEVRMEMGTATSGNVVYQGQHE